MQKEKTQKAPRESTLFIAILKFVPLIVLVLLILIAELDLLLAGPIAVFVAIAVAMYTNRVDFNTVYHIGLDSASKIIEVFFISQFAYAVAECFMATGVGASVINLALSAGVTPQTIGPLALIVTCVVSLATGTSWGTFAACAPIFLWMNYLIGGVPGDPRAGAVREPAARDGRVRRRLVLWRQHRHDLRHHRSFLRHAGC